MHYLPFPSGWPICVILQRWLCQCVEVWRVIELRVSIAIGDELNINVLLRKSTMRLNFPKQSI